MFQIPNILRRKMTFAVMIVAQGLCVPLGNCATMQFLPTSYLGASPLGLRAALPRSDGSVFGLEEGIKGGLTYGIGLNTVYDSNFSLSEHDPENELTVNIMPWITYCSDPEGGAPFSFNASYNPNIRTYLNNPGLNGMDHSGSINMKVEGAKTLITAYMNYNTVSGTDRYSGTFVQGSLLNAGISGTYQIAPRTSLFANFRLAMSDYGSSALVGSDTYSAEVGGFWSASERLSFGPAIRYTKGKSVNTGDRDAWALNMQAQYLMGEKLRFQGTLGLEYAKNSRDSGNSTLGLTGRLAASYAITERLQWESSVRYATEPSPTDMNYMLNNLTITTGLSRKLLRATVGLGVELDFSDYVGVGTTGTTQANEDNLSVILSYRRKLFLERVDFDSSIRYGLNSGGHEWSQIQVSAGIYFQF